MKKALIVFSFLFTLFVQAEIVSKPYGIITVPLEPYKLYHLGMPFDNEHTYLNLLEQLPEGSLISIWNNLNRKYVFSIVEQSNENDLIIKKGDAFYVSVTEPVKLKLYGKVPDATNSVKVIPNGISMTGLMYPTQFEFNNSQLSEELKFPSTLIAWDNELQIYKIFRKTKSGWINEEILFAPHEAFWIKRKGEVLLWQVTKPYSYP